jgi:transcription initiation factor TFIID subunit 3
MTSPPAVHHSLLRPSVLHILRAAGYSSTRHSVLDTLTDLAGRYMFLLANSAANHAEHNPADLELTVADIRMALQDCGAIAPEKALVDQICDEMEDTRGVEAFLEWVMGPQNKEIRRVSLEGGEDGKEDYLTGQCVFDVISMYLWLAVLKKKFDKTGDEVRYQGTILGKSVESRPIIEGADVPNLKEWANRLRANLNSQSVSVSQSRRPSSDLSSIEDQEMENMGF